MSHFGPELVAFLRDWLPPPPARILDAGCGAGEVTRHLAAQGYDAVGLDPTAPEDNDKGVRPLWHRGRLEDLTKGVRPLLRGEGGLTPFDAVVAIRSLHHVDDLDEALDALAAALRRGGRIVVFEFAVEHEDDAALRWLRSHGVAVGAAPHDIFTLAAVRAGLDRRFRPLLFEPAPYHAREFDRDDLVAAEEAAIEGGELRPAGAYMVHEA